jgi:hypothetical protein
MPLEPWYKVVEPRKEVREGRSFNPDEFAIHLEQVVAATAPEDYRNPAAFFARTCFTRALREHLGMVLRRLSGRTENSAPVLTLITQFGGGKTHTLTALYHLACTGSKAAAFHGIELLLEEAGVTEIPAARVAVFVGNAWDPQPGRETPWIDLAYQLAGDKGVEALGPSAKTTPPGTVALDRVFQAAGGCVLILFDEVLNFLNRHRSFADPFHAFIQNLTVATTGTTRGAAIISLPRSQVEMTDWDQQWQDKITKVVRRVAKDLVANDEAEISEVLRRRLFESLGNERIRKNVAKVYADWCFERRAQLPPEWTAVDTGATEKKARELLQKRFEDCYPFHPATISVFQRKWQTLTQFQQTRGTLAMLAQWISWAFRQGFINARREPLITLGSAPLEVPEFRAVVLGQLGEGRLGTAIDTDIAGSHSHARGLDADTKGPLRDIHLRTGATIFFESSGGMVSKMAHLPELRFALGEPDIDTTSIDNAAFALEGRAYYIRRAGSDGFRILYRPTLKKVVNDRKASLDLDTEVRPAMRTLVQKQFEKGASIPLVLFPADGNAVPDSPRLMLVLMDPSQEWTGSGSLRQQVATWTRRRGNSPRLYPAAPVWCFRKPGRGLQEKVETWLAWRRVADELERGELGSEYDKSEVADIRANVSTAEEDARDEVWAGYRYLALAVAPRAEGAREPANEEEEADGLQVIDLGAGHASASETLVGRIITALKSGGRLSDSVGISYIERNWPPALKTAGVWPLSSLRQSFLNGALTRLLDPDTTLRKKLVELVEKGELGLASGQYADGTYQRFWIGEPIDPAEILFDPGVFLLTKAKAQSLKVKPIPKKGEDHSEPTLDKETAIGTGPDTGSKGDAEAPGGDDSGARLPPKDVHLVLMGSIPHESWNRLGTKLVPKLRSGENLQIEVRIGVTAKAENAATFEAEVGQILQDLGLGERVAIQRS